MVEGKEYAVVYCGDYVNEDLRFKYCDTLEDAFTLYAGACQRAMARKIKATHLKVMRDSDRMIFADCRVWASPITHEEYWEELKRGIR